MSESDQSAAYVSIHKELIDACKEGSRSAQFRIYELYYKAMYNSALRITGDPDDAEDVMQEAFLKAFQKLDSYSGKVSFGAWLKKIVINKSLDFIRLKKTTVSLDGLGKDNEPVDNQTEEIVLKCEPEVVKKAIYALPEGYRIVLSLFLLEGYDHDEISSIMGITNATSRTQYHRAKKKLLELLKDMNAVS